jgi:hypothetical protein
VGFPSCWGEMLERERDFGIRLLLEGNTYTLLLGLVLVLYETSLDIGM